MPNKTANKTANPITALEKKLSQLKQQLKKAHQNHIASLQKSITSDTGKLKKAQAKVASLKGKKTPAADRQRINLTETIADLKQSIALHKNSLSAAKAELAKMILVEKTEMAAKKQYRTSKKTISKKSTILKKKAVKKAAKKAASPKKALTPDLSQPVVPTAVKPKKTWQPKSETVEAQTNEKSDLNKAKKIKKKSSSPNNTSDDIKSNTSKKEETKENLSEPPNRAETSPTSNEPQSETDKEPVITNWHAMPIVKTTDN